MFHLEYVHYMLHGKYWPYLLQGRRIAKCHQAGIQVTMVTGDYGLTAEAIARRIGLVDGKSRVVTGEDMGHLSDAQLRQILHQKSGLVTSNDS